EIGHACDLIDESQWAFVWVVDAPLFKPTGEDDDVAVGGGAWTAVHHAFTSPTPEWVDSFDEDPGNALAYAYDIVCNGHEIGEIGHACELIDESQWAFVWVVDAPLFKPTGEDDDVAVGGGAWTAVHHAFTSPTPEWVDSFDEDPGNALAYAYDIVCNGNEIG